MVRGFMECNQLKSGKLGNNLPFRHQTNFSLHALFHKCVNICPGKILVFN